MAVFHEIVHLALGLVDLPGGFERPSGGIMDNEYSLGNFSFLGETVPVENIIRGEVLGEGSRGAYQLLTFVMRRRSNS